MSEHVQANPFIENIIFLEVPLITKQIYIVEPCKHRGLHFHVRVELLCYATNSAAVGARDMPQLQIAGHLRSATIHLSKSIILTRSLISLKCVSTWLSIQNNGRDSQWIRCFSIKRTHVFLPKLKRNKQYSI